MGKKEDFKHLSLCQIVFESFAILEYSHKQRNAREK